MGMFDWIRCDVPLPDGRKPDELQTKAFDCEMVVHVINSDGRLMLDRGHFELTPIEQRPYPDIPSIGSLRRVPKYEDANFHGSFRFGDGWHEYEAKFTDGKLIGLSVLEKGEPIAVEAPVQSPLPSMAKWLVFDTETSDLPDYDKPADDVDQPRLASICMIFLDDDLQEVGSYTRLIKPDGWEISPGAYKRNGLTVAYLDMAGIPVNEVLDVYSAAIRNGCSVVAFNCQFDAKIMRGEFRRAARDDLFEETKQVCLMRAMGAWNKSEGRSGKWPNLKASLETIGYQREGEAHTADSDARAAVALMRFLHERGALPEPKVFYAKGK